ncbi:MAG: dihydroorotate dehydrogenase electron transfer subunit [Eubacterium sp.]|nr:dihydroorotate dehydrogenase electron transfer subunit [Candidatus Colimonas fimequi]
MKQMNLTILSNECIAEDIYRMVFETGEMLVEKPGQFINIKIDGFFLRRPISISDWTDNTLTIIYKVVGAGTEVMKEMTAGQVLDVLLPLGNGFDIMQSGERPLLVGGGVGVPPMFGVAKELIAAGVKPVVVMGFNEESQIFLAEDFEAIGAEVHIATADGSVGTKGFVTDVVKDLEYTSIFTCGPLPMLRALDSCAPAEIPGWFSFEERMGCGFGACMGCSCKTKYGNKRICKDGPILERGEIIW